MVKDIRAGYLPYGNQISKGIKMSDLFHTDNTAEAAYMMLNGAKLVDLELSPGDHKVTIVLKDNGNQLLGDWIINWPTSPEFKYYAHFNLLTIQIKRLLNGYRRTNAT
jgi:hypothetical protein